MLVVAVLAVAVPAAAGTRLHQEAGPVRDPSSAERQSILYGARGFADAVSHGTLSSIVVGVARSHPTFARVEAATSYEGQQRYLLHRRSGLWIVISNGDASQARCFRAYAQPMKALGNTCASYTSLRRISLTNWSTGTPPGERSVQPKSIQLTNHDWLDGLKWKGWGKPDAVATGTAHVDDCKPDCASGSYHTYRVRYHLGWPTTSKTYTSRRVYGYSALVFRRKPAGYMSRIGFGAENG